MGPFSRDRGSMMVAAPVPRDALDRCLPNRGRFSSRLGNSSFPSAAGCSYSVSPRTYISKKVVKGRCYQSTLWVLRARLQSPENDLAGGLHLQRLCKFAPSKNPSRKVGEGGPEPTEFAPGPPFLFPESSTGGGQL